MTRIAGAMASVELPAQQVLELMARGVQRRRGHGGGLPAVHRDQQGHQTVRDLVAPGDNATCWP